MLITNNAFVPSDKSILYAREIPNKLVESIEIKIIVIDSFQYVIDSKSKQNANGKDDIGYSILQMRSKHSDTLMPLISKAMLKYGKFTLRRLMARSILLFKHDDLSSLENCRPLTIPSCVYIEWTSVVFPDIQEMNVIR